jgi:predicted glycosyltransferase
LIVFYVQHLLGSGHLQRVRLIAEALLRREQQVAIISGGFPSAAIHVDGAEFIQLSSLRSDGVDFARLIDENGDEADQNLFKQRSDSLCRALRRLKPEVFVIESWPFGRRVFGSELKGAIAELEKLDPATRVICSIRDILQVRKMKRQQETAELVMGLFDKVMVHGDPEVVSLVASFECANLIASKIHYTGYIAPAPVPRKIETQDIVVAAGSGAAGSLLYAMAIDAALLDQSGRTWRILAGTELAESVKSRGANLPRHIIIEANRSDFRELLASAKLLISQAGYNTMMDVLVTGVPTLFVPFEGVGETEQMQRAALFEKLGVGKICPETASAESLLTKVQEVLRLEDPHLPTINLAGIENSVDFLLQQGALSRHP